MQQMDLLARLPLAEGVFRLWQASLPDERLGVIYEQHRGRCYEKKISFPLVVQLLADALCQSGGSGRASFEHSAESRESVASIQAFYGKLRRLPIEVSEAFLAEGSRWLRELYPAAAARELPSCLRAFEVLIVDGKAIKRVAKRLKVTRGRAGGVLGGRALVCLSMRSGLAVAMAGHPDGEINDVRLVPQLLPQVRSRLRGPRLWVEDRAFCDLKQPALFCEEGDQFLVRHHQRLQFRVDTKRPSGCGQDAEARQWVEDWGWVGGANDQRRRRVRRIRLKLAPQEQLVLLTSLLDAERYPAVALLEVYRQRWGIERVFQLVTEVFGLEGLIGSSAQASVFQLAFCLELYNSVQVLRGYVAAGNHCQAEQLSMEKLFVDVERELIAWSVLGRVRETVEWLAQPRSLKQCRQRLRQRVGVLWEDRWKKSPPQKRRCHPSRGHAPGKHTSVFRIVEEYRRRSKINRRHDE